MSISKYLAFFGVVIFLMGCSDNERNGVPGTLPGNSLLSFSVLYNGSYYPAQQDSETAWHASLPSTATDTAYYARYEVAEGIHITPHPNMLLSYPRTFTLNDDQGNSLDVTISIDNDLPYYGLWLTANETNHYPNILPNQERLIILPADATNPTLNYLLPEGSTISPAPDLSNWPENTDKEFTITDSQGISTTTTYRWVRNNYFTMIVFGDPEYDMRGLSGDGREIKELINQIINLKNNTNLYFEPVEGLRVDYGPELVLCLGDIDSDANSNMDKFMSVFGALYDNGIPFVTIYGNHDWSTYNWWDTADNGFTLILDNGNYGFTSGEESNNERTLALVDRSIEESQKLGVTLERKFLSTDYGHNYEGEVSPFVFSFRGIRFYCGQTYWFQQWYTPTSGLLGKLRPATFHCTDEIMEELENKIENEWGKDPAVWIQHYPMSDTQTDGGSSMWWHNRQGFGPEANDPNANQSVKWPTYEDKVTQMMNVINKTKNPIFFAGHTHQVATHKHATFTEYITPYFRNKGIYVVLMKEGEGAIETIQYSL